MCGGERRLAVRPARVRPSTNTRRDVPSAGMPVIEIPARALARHEELVELRRVVPEGRQAGLRSRARRAPASAGSLGRRPGVEVSAAARATRRDDPPRRDRHAYGTGWTPSRAQRSPTQADRRGAPEGIVNGERSSCVRGAEFRLIANQHVSAGRGAQGDTALLVQVTGVGAAPQRDEPLRHAISERYVSTPIPRRLLLLHLRRRVGGVGGGRPRGERRVVHIGAPATPSLEVRASGCLRRTRRGFVPRMRSRRRSRCSAGTAA